MRKQRTTLESYLPAILDSLSDAVVVVDNRGTIVWVNSRVKSLFGYEPDELVGASVDKLVPPNVRLAHVKLFGAFSLHPTPRHMQTAMPRKALRKDGSEVLVGISLNPLQVGDSHFVASIIRDISDWRNIEMQLRTMQKMTETVLGGVAQYGGSKSLPASPSPRRDARNLSPREIEILQLLSEGKRNKAIASALGISTKTVETHRARIMLKINVHSLAELIRYAFQRGMASP